MASIREVAALAKVSPATVSRVINGTAKVDDEKRERVLKAIADTGFVPNEVARSLFRKSAKMIGLILPSIVNPYFTELASVIEKTADANGFRILLCNTGGDVEREKAAIQMLEAMNADGIIITNSNEDAHECIKNCRIPVVVTDRNFNGDVANAYIHCNHYQGGRMAAEHLIECGCKNIVCLKESQHISSARERFNGYRDVCREQGIDEKSIDCGYDFESASKATEKLLEKYPEADGIIACNDIVAISVYKALHKKHIKVPEQIQIIGFDGINLSEFLTPELTTIVQPIEDMGKKAAELIIHNDFESNRKEYIYDVRLVIRETTKEGE